MPATATSARRTRRPVWLVPVLVGLVAALLIAASLISGRDEDPNARAQDPAPTEQTSEGADETTDTGETSEEPASEAGESEAGEPEQSAMPDVSRRDPDDPMAAGPVDAPVSLIVYSDFQCPFCALWTEQTQPTMLEYAEAGDLRIEWRDINVFGQESITAARAAYAAGLQDRYHDYHGALFEGGEKRPASELDEESLVELADELGLDTEQFASDLGSEEVAAGVAENQDESASLGVFSTPAFILGETPILGAQPTEVFVETVEDELAKAEG